ILRRRSSATRARATASRVESGRDAPRAIAVLVTSSSRTRLRTSLQNASMPNSDRDSGAAACRIFCAISAAAVGLLVPPVNSDSSRNSVSGSTYKPCQATVRQGWGRSRQRETWLPLGAICTAEEERRSPCTRDILQPCSPVAPNAAAGSQFLSFRCILVPSPRFHERLQQLAFPKRPSEAQPLIIDPYRQRRTDNGPNGPNDTTVQGCLRLRPRAAQFAHESRRVCGGD